MPGRNGMGPLGNGPMTGRRMGNCNSNGNANMQGRGCGMGLSRGRGRGNSFGLNANSLAQPKQDELTKLKQQAEVINKRISELEEKE